MHVKASFHHYFPIMHASDFQQRVAVKYQHARRKCDVFYGLLGGMSPAICFDLHSRKFKLARRLSHFGEGLMCFLNAENSGISFGLFFVVYHPFQFPMLKKVTFGGYIFLFFGTAPHSEGAINSKTT